MLTMDTRIKVLDEYGAANYSGCLWNLPKGKRPGKLMPRIDGALSICSNGYHFTTIRYVAYWLHCGGSLYVYEARGEEIYDVIYDVIHDKGCSRQARLLRRLKWTAQDSADLAAYCVHRAKLIRKAKNFITSEDNTESIKDYAISAADEVLNNITPREDYVARLADFAQHRLCNMAPDYYIEVAVLGRWILRRLRKNDPDA